MSPPHDPSDVPAENEARFRWQTLFQQTTEPLFVLNRRRRVVFVNRAWEALTGLTLADVKGQVCRRRPRGILVDKLDVLLGALAPPVEVIDGQPGQARRLSPSATVPAWWQIAFFPLAGSDGSVGILGKITVLARPTVSTGLPLSEKMLDLRQRHLQHYRLEEMVSEVPAVARLCEQIRLAAQTRLPVLIVGPPGAGKQWVARTIHCQSPQREQTFACLDCARLPADRIAELLFGSGRSTQLTAVYLQNLDSLPLQIQERLHQRLEIQAEDLARILAGLAQDPFEAVRSGKLLHDLYCRLSPVIVQVPALKDRMDDFAAWLERLLARANQAAERAVRSVSSEASLLLRAHAWPGNLRELYEVLVGACLRAKGDQIEAGDLPFYLRHGPVPPEKPLALDAILEEVERRLIMQSLRMAKNNKSRAAELLTVWRARLLRRMENLGIKEEPRT